MKFLLDDNVPYSVKTWLQDKGFEASKLNEIGLKGAEDEEIYKHAVQKNFTLVTLDLDFGYLFLKMQQGTIIVLRPKVAVPKDILHLLETSIDIITKKKGLMIVKPGKIRIINP